MKVLLVILHAHPSRGGAEAYTVRLLHKLRERGHDAFIAAATFADAVPEAWRIPLKYDGLMRTSKYQTFIDDLDKHLATNKYDILHTALPLPQCDVYHPHAGVEAMTLRQASVAQRIFNRRRQRFAHVERQMLRTAKPVVLCLSKRARSDLLVQMPVDPDRAITLYSAPDDADFVPTGAPGDGALFIGQDFHRKGLDVAIASVLRVEGLKLRVIGGDDPAPFGRHARVEFLGQRDDVARELARSAVLIHPARHEPFGMVVVEAMLMGVPPVVSSNAGVSEVVRDGVDGRVVDGEDPDRWASALRDALANRESMSRACLARREELSYAHHLDELLSIYDRILASRQPR